MSLTALLCALAIAASLVVAIFNWAGFLAALRAKRSYSFMPASAFAVVGVIGLLFYPDASISRFAWLPLIVDPGFGLVALALLVKRLRQLLMKR